MYEELSNSIGLTNQESQVYTALLSLGRKSATAIAKYAKLNRTTIYYSLEKLIEKGLVSYIDIDSVRYFTATRPELLSNLIETQKNETAIKFKDKEKMLKEIMPQLKSLQNIPDEDVKIEVLEGKQSVKNYFYRTLKIIKDENINELLSLNMSGTGFMREHVKYERDSIIKNAMKKIDKKKFSVKWLYLGPKDQEDENEVTKYIGERKYVYSNEKVFTNTHVYGDYLDIILVPKKPVIITIKNKYAADTFRAMFNVIWGMS